MWNIITIIRKKLSEECIKQLTSLIMLHITHSICKQLKKTEKSDSNIFWQLS